MNDGFPPGLEDALRFPLVEALFGRRARRFALGGSIPDGPLAHSSEHEPVPLTEIEQAVLLVAASGNTSWHYMIAHNPHYAPHLPNYAGAAGGRTFASAAGFHTSDLFFTDDNGAYYFPTRDAPALVDRQDDGRLDVHALLEAHRSRVRKLSDGRIGIPSATPYVEGHNLWCVNQPGSTLIIPVGDLAQHMIAALCYFVQNGSCIYDDMLGEPIRGLERFGNMVDLESPLPLSFLEQQCLAECTAELTMACYAGMLMLQAMGLGGWLFDGIDPYSVLGASGDPEVPGLGFRYDTHPDWALPNPTGLHGVFEGYCPPHYPNMRAAVDAFAERKFGPGGPFHPDTPGPWRETAEVRGSAEVHSEEFRECVALMAQHIYDHYGKFPGTMPSILVVTYLQAHHLDTTFYDRHFAPGAYLETHARHMERWHPGE